MARIEYKYLLPAKLVPELLKHLLPYLEMDKYSKEITGHNYTVRSIYYDTSAMDYYHEKLSGLKRRKKVRIRGYNSESPKSLTFLEIKKKNGPTISKIRAAVRYQDLSSLLIEKDLEKYIINGDKMSHHVNDAGQFFYYMQRENLNPTIKVIYEREAYFYKFNHDLRITVDSNLRSSLNVNIDSLYDEDHITYAIPGECCLEVKLAGEIPEWLSTVLSLLNLHLQAFSKYTMCLDTHSKYEWQLNRSLHGSARYDIFKFNNKPERNHKTC